MDSTQFSKRIKYLVDHLEDGNNSRFASKIGCNESVIRNYKNGGVPRGDIIVKIAEIYGVSTEWLLLGIGDIFIEYSINHQEIHGDNNIVTGNNSRISSKNQDTHTSKDNIHRIEELARQIEELKETIKAKDALLLKREQRIEQLTDAILQKMQE